MGLTVYNQYKFLGNYDTKNLYETKNESSILEIETFPPIFTSYFRFVTRHAQLKRLRETIIVVIWCTYIQLQARKYS